MKLSIIIPAHNEEKTIAEVLRRVLEVDLGQWEREVIVVDDGSRDGTPVQLEKVKTKFNGRQILFLRHAENLGKGMAIKSALQKVTGDYVIIQDADLEYFPGDIPKLLSALPNPSQPPLLHRGGETSATPSFSKEGVGGVVVFGDRGIKRYPERGFHYVVGAKLLTWVVNLLYGARLHDLYTGYKLIPSNIIKALNLQSTGFEFEAEVTCKLLKKGFTIEEVTINYLPRNKEQGKHIRAKDALVGLWVIIKYRFL